MKTFYGHLNSFKMTIQDLPFHNSKILPETLRPENKHLISMIEQNYLVNK